MKSLNRTLSLVLVLAMCLGLMGVASAASFTDASSIKYTEAVGVMSGIGAINGYTDGTYKPTGTITREEAAKMITYAVLGSDVASRLTVAATGFTDVAADRWSAPYIAYLVGQGIINGMGDGTFAPTANVTAYQLAKMMLCAAGYGAKGEFTGSGWELTVAVKANTTGIFSGIASGVDYSKAATREEAALYIFNGITSVPMVTYSKLTEAYTSVPNAVGNASTASDNAVNPDLVMQIAESVYGAQLVKNTSAIKDGVSGRSWTYKGTTIVGFAAGATVLATDKTGTAFSKLTTNTDSAYIGYAPDTAVKYYYNGIEIKAFLTEVTGSSTGSLSFDLAAGDHVMSLANNTLYKATNAIPKTTAITTGNAPSTSQVVPYAGVKGAIVTFSDTDSDSKYDVVSFTKDTVTKLTSAPTTKTTGEVTKVTISSITGLSAGVNVKNVSGYEGLAKGDIVLWHFDGTNYFITKTTSVTGTLNAYNSVGGTVMVDATTYKTSALKSDIMTDLIAVAGKAASTFYLDEAGFICYVVQEDNGVTLANTAFVLEQAGNGTALDPYKAVLLMADGTTVTAALSKVNGSVGAATRYNFYTYVKNADGTYKLTDPSTGGQLNKASNYDGATGSADVVFARGQADFFYRAKDSGTLSGKLGTASTVFVAYSNSKYNTYTGIANVPKVLATDSTTEAAVLYDANNYVLFAVALNVTTDGTVSSLDYVFAPTPASTVVTATETYYVYSDAYVNGVKQTMLPATEEFLMLPGYLYAVKGYSSQRVDQTTFVPANTLIYDFDDTTPFTIKGGITAFTVSGGTITAAGASSYVTSADCKYFLYDQTLTVPTVEEISAEAVEGLTLTPGQKFAIQGLKKSSSDNTLSTVYISIYTEVPVLLGTTGAAFAKDDTVVTALGSGTMTIATAHNTAAELSALLRTGTRIYDSNGTLVTGSTAFTSTNHYYFVIGSNVLDYVITVS